MSEGQVLLREYAYSSEDMESIGRHIAAVVPLEVAICMFGGLGAGKTTLSKGIVSEIAGLDVDEVSSPSFSYLHIYDGAITVYHIDCFRLKSIDEFLSKGLEEFLCGFCIIEWPHMILPVLGLRIFRVDIELSGEVRMVSLYNG